MKRKFEISNFFQVPDGTMVAPFLNANDSESGLPFGLLDGFSIAAGRIPPRTKSKIHIMPLVTQVTFVRQGVLTVWTKGDGERAPHPLHAKEGEAVLTEPGAFIQLDNSSDVTCEVLYIVSPAYLFLSSKPGQKPEYDDSVMIEGGWDELASAGWQPGSPLPTREERREAERRLAVRSKRGA